MKKRIVLTTLLFVFLACILSAHAFAATVASGFCGDLEENDGHNVIWVLDDSGTLTISGNGNMSNFTSDYDVPWYSFCSNIIEVNILSGIKSLGKNAFSNCSNLIRVTIPDGLQSIGYYAFSGCTSLKSVYITDLKAWFNIKF